MDRPCGFFVVLLPYLQQRKPFSKPKDAACFKQPLTTNEETKAYYKDAWELGLIPVLKLCASDSVFIGFVKWNNNIKVTFLIASLEKGLLHYYITYLI